MVGGDGTRPRNRLDLFDSHFHIIDPRYPLVANNGYVPESFTTADYLARLSGYQLVGGALVSGSFQAFDQNYLIAALKALGPRYVGVTQLPYDVNDERILELHSFGIRALRFNLHRGGSEGVGHLVSMAKRIYELVGWSTELYVDSSELGDLYPLLAGLPSGSIDHIGLSKLGFRHLCKLVEQGWKVKATGFGRVDFDVTQALVELYQVNPHSLMFGTDLPSTRAPRPYRDDDFDRVVDALGEQGATRVLSQNAVGHYLGAVG